MEDEPRYEVHIRQHSDPNYVHVLGEGGVSERRADRLYDGASINLNHDDFYIEMVRVGDAS